MEDPRDEYEIGDELPVQITRKQLLKAVELCRSAIDARKLESYFALKALLFLEIQSAIQLDGRHDYDELLSSLTSSLESAPWPKLNDETG